MAVGIFAGIAVNDVQRALAWYRRFLGADSTFHPNDLEVVWRLAEDRHVYLIQDTDRAGGAVSMIWADDPIAEVARIAGQGIEPVDVKKHDGVWNACSTTPTATRQASVGKSRRDDTHDAAQPFQHEEARGDDA